MHSWRTIKHCKACGASVVYAVPAGDNRERAVCGQCHTVHYVNPINVVGTVPAWGNSVLLCLRNIEPRRGYWTLPAGFQELGETTTEGALRETLEEAGAAVELQSLYSVLNVVHVGQLHLYYTARLRNLEFAPGNETIEVALFKENEVPWERLAFRTVRTTLKHWFEDARTDMFSLHCEDIS